MKRFVFVRTFVLEAEDEDEAWDLLDEGLEYERKDGNSLSDSWAIDSLEQDESDQ